MHVLMTGAAGMIGCKLTGVLIKAGGLANRPLEALTPVDVVRPAAPEAFLGEANARDCDIARLGEAAAQDDGNGANRAAIAAISAEDSVAMSGGSSLRDSLGFALGSSVVA
jgi:hypothetical protein